MSVSQKNIWSKKVDNFERRRLWGSVHGPDRFFGSVSCLQRLCQLRPPVEGTCRLWGEPGWGEVEEGFRSLLPIICLFLELSSFSTIYNSPDPGLVLIADLVLVINSVFHCLFLLIFWYQKWHGTQNIDWDQVPGTFIGGNLVCLGARRRRG